MFLLIDNYDSFTYNLAQAFSVLRVDVRVMRNDAASVDEILAMRPQAVVVSPGPGSPRDAGVCVELIRSIDASLPLLGVCLGHQAIVEAFGGVVGRAQSVAHGKASMVFHNRLGLFAGLPLPMEAGRYHSLVAERSSLPEELIVDAELADGTVMALHHACLPIYGVQFHPESILTPHGGAVLKNFVQLAHLARRQKGCVPC